TGLSAGTATITGAYMGFMASGTVTVTAATLTSIEVTPPTFALRVGESQGLNATALYSDGTTRNVTGMATWSSSNQMVADVSNAGGGGPGGGGGRGTVAALSAGSVTITANFMGLTATSVGTITDATLVSLQVTPVNLTLPKGESRQYQ